ncbi:MAG: TatD family hydrolase [Chitinophagales bacterium]|nr:TatD family hydrolase [Chitinophagales bacterium]
MLIDTHAHLYHKEFEKDIEEVLQRCAANGVKRVYLPAIDTQSHERMHRLLLKSGLQEVELQAMMGVHPCSINEHYLAELDTAYAYLNNGSYCAVGEIGLDFYWDVTYKEQQLAAFDVQINWATERKLPIVIHSRNSTQECINTVMPYVGKLTGIFHCFSGTYEQAKQIMDLGFYLGIGGVATYKNSNLIEILQKTGLSRVVLETDAPYLSPMPFRGKRNESSYIRNICDHLSLKLELDTAEIERITTDNALAAFS